MRAGIGFFFSKPAKKTDHVLAVVTDSAEEPSRTQDAATVTLAAVIIAGLATAWGWALLQFVHLFVQPGVESLREEVTRITLT